MDNEKTHYLFADGEESSGGNDNINLRCAGCMKEFSGEFELCPHCGYVVGAKPENPYCLFPGTWLAGNYMLGKVIGQGGFGITYIAWDKKGGRKVAIKEFFPNALSTRREGKTQVDCYNDRAKKHFKDGVRKMLEEGERLASFRDNENIVDVYDYFEENGTAYIVMEYLDGKSLKEYAEEKGGKLDPKEAVKLMLPVLNALSAMHRKKMIHRDVAPDNIYLCEDGKVKLLDFGSARLEVQDASKSLSVMVKAGYAPMEQYASRSKQGPWTDVYSACATLYKLITGKVPVESVERDVTPLKTFAELGINNCRELEEIIVKGLAIEPQDRFATAEELAENLRSLEFEKTAKPKTESISKPEIIEPEKNEENEKNEKSRAWILIALSAVIVVVVALVAWFTSTGGSSSEWTQSDDGKTTDLSVTETETEKGTVLEGYEAVTDEDGNVSYILSLVELEVGTNIVSSTAKKFIFVPPQDGYYKFESINTDGADFEGRLVDDYGNIICIDTDAGESNNFLMHGKLTAGETYYLAPYLYGSDSDDYPTLEVEITLVSEVEAIGHEVFIAYEYGGFYMSSSATLYYYPSYSADETSWSSPGVKSTGYYEISDQILWLGFDTSDGDVIWYPIELDDEFKRAFELFIVYKNNGLYFSTDDELYEYDPEVDSVVYWDESAKYNPDTFIVKNGVLWLGFNVYDNYNDNWKHIWYPIEEV